MKKVSRRKFLKRSILASFGLLFLNSFWFEKYIIDWNQLNLNKTNKKSIKVIQISDLHIDSIQNFHKSLAEKINAKKPDLIVITGDAIDINGNLSVLDEFLQLINVSIKKYAITGNWEYWGKIDLLSLKAIYSKYNCDLLINENRTLSIHNRSISIIGIDDYVGGNADFSKSVQGLEKSDTNLVLSHCPAHRDIIAKQNKNIEIDLILSGHTHGGQITLFGFAPFRPPGSGNYLKGLYNSYPPLYVSKGIGTSVLPFRLGARAEIIEFDL